MSGLKARLASAEQRLAILRPGIRTVEIRGGLESGVAPIATIDGKPFERWEGEPSDAFRLRAKAYAVDSDARVLVFGGLPPRNTGAAPMPRGEG
jgi:hypothetical protein